MVCFILIVLIAVFLITCTWVKCEKQKYINYSSRNNVEDSMSDSKVN